MSSAAQRKRDDVLMRTAVHEAGHAVLSAAINATPVFASIHAEGQTLGRSGVPIAADAASIAQVHLAGFAAEHILMGRRPRQLNHQVRFAIYALGDRALLDAFMGTEDQDGHQAVKSVLEMGSTSGDEELADEIERLYKVAYESLRVVWLTVGEVAGALLKHGLLDRDELNEAMGGVDLHTPVAFVQNKYGLFPTPPGLRKKKRSSRSAPRK